MKYTFLILAFMASTFAANAQTLPDRKTTVEYITKLFKDARGFEWKLKNGSAYKIDEVYVNSYEKIPFDISILENSTTSIFYGEKGIGSGKLSFGKGYRGIDWAKTIKIEDSATEVIEDSPVKFLYIEFIQNSILERTYSEEYNPYGNLLRQSEKGTSRIYFPYKNEPGVKERLIKALNHLSSLDKATKAKNDPFGN